MRILLTSLSRSVLIVIGTAIPLLVRAGENPFVESRFQTGKTQGAAGVSSRSFEDIVGSMIKGALSIAGVFFFAYIVWAGYLWMTAHGEEDKITQAKKMISGGIIGLAIVLAAYAMAQFVVTNLSDATGIR